jgi:hypothetical protein
VVEAYLSLTDAVRFIRWQRTRGPYYSRLRVCNSVASRHNIHYIVAQYVRAIFRIIMQPFNTLLEQLKPVAQFVIFVIYHVFLFLALPTLMGG